MALNRSLKDVRTATRSPPRGADSPPSRPQSAMQVSEGSERRIRRLLVDLDKAYAEIERLRGRLRVAGVRDF